VVGFLMLANSKTVGGGFTAMRLGQLAKEGGSQRVSALNPPVGFEGWKGAPIWVGLYKS
jgi:hypothetical protein